MARLTLLRASAVAAGAALILTAGATTASAASPRTFSCSGAVDRYVAYTVTGSLTAKSQPYAVSVVWQTTGATVAGVAGRAPSLGASLVHAGYVTWNLTGPQSAGDLYQLSTPPVLPGGGGFFDADLEVLYAGGANGSNVLTMTNCTVAGARVEVAKVRTFSCTGIPAEAATTRTVTGSLNRNIHPNQVKVTDAAGLALSTRTRSASLVGASWLQAGFQQWTSRGPTPGRTCTTCTCRLYCLARAVTSTASWRSSTTAAPPAAGRSSSPTARWPDLRAVGRRPALAQRRSVRARVGVSGVGCHWSEAQSSNPAHQGVRAGLSVPAGTPGCLPPAWRAGDYEPLTTAGTRGGSGTWRRC